MTRVNLSTGDALALCPAAGISWSVFLISIFPKNQPPQVVYIVVLASACTVNAVNILATLGALKSRSIFTPAPRWSPLIFAEMVHEASA